MMNCVARFAPTILPPSWRCNWCLHARKPFTSTGCCISRIIKYQSQSRQICSKPSSIPSIAPSPSRHRYAHIWHPTQPRTVSVHIKLQTQIQVAAHLEDTTQPKCQRYRFAAQEEVAHLHHVTQQPIDDNRQSEPLTRSCLMILEYLWQWESGFDSQPDITQQVDVCCRFRNRR